MKELEEVAPQWRDSKDSDQQHHPGDREKVSGVVVVKACAV